MEIPSEGITNANQGCDAVAARRRQARSPRRDGARAQTPRRRPRRWVPVQKKKTKHQSLYRYREEKK